MNEARLFQRVLDDLPEAGEGVMFAHTALGARAGTPAALLALWPGGQRAIHRFRGKGRGPERVTWRPLRSTLGGVVTQVTLFLSPCRAGKNVNVPPGVIMSDFMRAGPVIEGKPL